MTHNEKIRRGARQMIRGRLDIEEEMVVPRFARVRRAEQPEIHGYYGHYVEVRTWLYVPAGAENVEA